MNSIVTKHKFFSGALALFLCVFTTPLSAAPTIFEKKDLLNDQDQLDVYRTLPNKKSLETSPQFIVVDDFNSGKMKKRHGTTWRVKSPVIGAVDLGLDKIDGRNPSRGYSLQARFHLLKGEKAMISTFLDLLDVSKADYFVFRIRVDSQAEDNKLSGRIRLKLTDWKHREVIYDLSDQVTSNLGEWTDVILPIRVFKSLDLDSLFSLGIKFLANQGDLKGQIWIDEIAFFGFNDVGFESNQDNLVGFPKKLFYEKRRNMLRETEEDDYFLRLIAHDVWRYFENARDKKTQLIVDHLRMGDSPLAAAYTSPTNIAMDILSTIGAMDLKFIGKKEAEEKTLKIVQTLEKIRKYKGLFYNFYDTKKLTVTRSYISSVDNGWLGIALVVLRQAFEGKISERVSKILDEMDFDEFLDPENQQLVIGFDVPVRNFGGYHYGMLVSEARATSLLAIGKEDVMKEHWWLLFRTPPKQWDWQNQNPQGKRVEHDGIDYFQGYYEYRGQQFVPSWGGSLFEYLMPTLVLKERELATEGLGKNNRIISELHRDYALIEKKYPVWGISPAAMTNGRRWHYSEFGIKQLSVKGYPDIGVVTPHVSFLALDTIPKDAIKNIRKLLEFKIYGEYGPYDSLRIKTYKANPQYLALDQGMIFVAIVNYLTQGKIQERFHQDSVGKNIESLLAKEKFF